MQTEQDDLILIRHGQSNFNRGENQYLQSKDLNLSWEQLSKLEDYKKKVLYAQQHIDSHLSENGRQQCKTARENLKNIQIDIILVSPYQRALETCREIFGDRIIKVEIHPVLAEVFRYACDVNHKLQMKIKQFKNYDFSHMKDKSELWFIDHLAKHHQKTCHLYLEQQPKGFKEKQIKMLELLKSKTVYESDQELNQRTRKVKEILGEYKQKYKKIAVVSHYYLIQHLINESFDQQGKPINPEFINNATPIFKNIGRLLKIK